MRMLPALLLSLFLIGCSQTPLYTKLNEKQANEMLAAMNAAGVNGSKAIEDGGTWQIQTSKNDFAPALAALQAQGLPRDDFANLGSVFKKEGFVSSPLEEHARLMYGLSQELSHTLSNIDGVMVARVHLAVPENDPLADKPKLSAASIFIKYRSDVDLSKQVGHIKALVVNSVEGLPYDNVTVMLFPAQPPLINTIQSSPDLTTNMLVGLGVVLALVAAITGFTYLRRWLARRTPVTTEVLPISDGR